MPSSRRRQRLADIIENIDRISIYVEGMSIEAYRADRKTIDAVERCLERISEAARKLGDEAERSAPHLPWRDIRGIGNWLRHEYDVLDDALLWKTIKVDLIPLRAACVAALEGEPA